MLIPVAPVFLVKRSVTLCHVLYKASSLSCCRPMQKLLLEGQKSRVYCELGVIVHVPMCSTMLKEELSDFPQEIWQMRAGLFYCKCLYPRAIEKTKLWKSPSGGVKYKNSESQNL